MRNLKSSSSSMAEWSSVGLRGAVVGRVALAGLCCLGLGAAARGQAPTHADVDGDGLVHAQEVVLGTEPTTHDSDRDGFSDLEELTRKSSPLVAGSRPDASKRMSVGMTVHAQNNGVHVLVGVFMSDMDLRSKQVQIGLLAHGQLVTLSNAYLAAHANLTYHAASVGSGCIALIDLTLDPSLVHGAGQLVVWAKARVPGTLGATSADSVHLMSIGGLVVYVMPLPGTLQASLKSKESSGSTASIYVPLVPTPGGGGAGGNGSGSGSGGVPATWEPGQVCFQRSSPVATDGATVTNEVIESGCTAGWDGFCPPSCSSSVGSTYRTVDPLTLIGG